MSCKLPTTGLGATVQGGPPLRPRNKASASRGAPSFTGRPISALWHMPPFWMGLHCLLLQGFQPCSLQVLVKAAFLISSPKDIWGGGTGKITLVGKRRKIQKEYWVGPLSPACNMGKSPISDQSVKGVRGENLRVSLGETITPIILPI